ncbi:MAG: hypothetical protein ACLPHP_12220 [Candidatus Sulfotelmatobacter sp.]
MGSVAEWTNALEAGVTFAVLTAFADVVLRYLFGSRSSLPGRWTVPLVAGYFCRQALLGLWFGLASSFGRRMFHGLLAVVFAASVVGWLILVVWFARAVERRNVSR